MSWEMGGEIAPAISAAITSGDVAEMRRILVAHPDYLRYEDGTDVWLHQAASVGNLPAVEMLVDLGLGVNEPSYLQNHAIEAAVGHGHVDIVRWLLEHGATVNRPSSRGILSCFDLMTAARQGRLDIVKLLVEHGANVHTESHGMNVLMHAVGKEVKAYLRSVGAYDLREVTPPDHTTAHEKVVEYMTEARGPLSDWTREIPGDPRVVLRHVPPNPLQEQEQILFTVGLCDRELPEADHEFGCAELRLALPPNWPLTAAALADPRWNWPVEGLVRMVETLRAGDRWPAEPVVFPHGDPPAPLGPGTDLCGWLVVPADGEAIQLPDHRWVGISFAYPVHAGEMRLVRAEGTWPLFSRLAARSLSFVADPQRPDVSADPEP